MLHLQVPLRVASCDYCNRTNTTDLNLFLLRRHDEVQIFGTGGMILQNMKDLLQVIRVCDEDEQKQKVMNTIIVVML